MAIRSFGDSFTRKVFKGDMNDSKVRRFALADQATEKLDLIEFAEELRDLAMIPGLKLEKKKGNLKEFHSIRINAQWRIIFIWIGDGAHDVKIVDYH